MMQENISQNQIFGEVLALSQMGSETPQERNINNMDIDITMIVKPATWKCLPQLWLPTCPGTTGGHQAGYLLSPAGGWSSLLFSDTPYPMTGIPQRQQNL